MFDTNDFDLNSPLSARSSAACAPWAALLPDAADGLLSEVEQAALDLHIAGCPACAAELAEAQQGAAWLGLLKTHAPEPSPALLDTILAKTTGLPAAAEIPLAPAAIRPLQPALAALPKAPVRHADHPLAGFAAFQRRFGRWVGANDTYVPAVQPRLAITAAMAFFSVCLTLNLLGVSTRSLHAEVLRPADLQRTVADKRASLLRSFEGIRVVYRVESRVNEWMTATSEGNAPLPSAQ